MSFLSPEHDKASFDAAAAAAGASVDVDPIIANAKAIVIDIDVFEAEQDAIKAAIVAGTCRHITDQDDEWSHGSSVTVDDPEESIEEIDVDVMRTYFISIGGDDYAALSFEKKGFDRASFVIAYHCHNNSCAVSVADFIKERYGLEPSPAEKAAADNVELKRAYDWIKKHSDRVRCIVSFKRVSKEFERFAASFVDYDAKKHANWYRVEGQDVARVERHRVDSINAKRRSMFAEQAGHRLRRCVRNATRTRLVADDADDSQIGDSDLEDMKEQKRDAERFHDPDASDSDDDITQHKRHGSPLRGDTKRVSK